MHYLGWPSFRKFIHNERVQCTLLNPKLALGAFRTILSLQKWSVRTLLGWYNVNAAFRVTKLLKNISQWTCPMHLIRPKYRVWVRFVPFCHFENDWYEFCSGDTVWMHHSGWPNFQKFCRNERLQCTLLDLKLTFWCVSYHFVTTTKMTITNFARGIQCECTILGDWTSRKFFATNASTAP